VKWFTPRLFGPEVKGLALSGHFGHEPPWDNGTSVMNHHKDRSCLGHEPPRGWSTSGSGTFKQTQNISTFYGSRWIILDFPELPTIRENLRAMGNTQWSRIFHPQTCIEDDTTKPQHSACRSPRFP
jgi:hypothetical protein